MTANLRRLDPSGADTTDVATASPLTVIKGGTGTVKYNASQGMDRGSNVGIRFTAPAAADQANITYSTTAAAAGTGQQYGVIEAWPTGGVQEFMTLRTASGNCIRQMVSTAGSVTVQNQAGTTVATLGSISLNTRYRFELEATPGTTTSNGSGRARIYDDDDTLVYDSGALTAGNYGGGLATKTVSIVRAGDPATATTSGFIANFTQVAIDTDTTPPTISPVAKNSILGSLASSVPLATGSIAGDSSNPGALAATVPIATGSIAGDSTNPAAIAAMLPAPTSAIAGTSTNPGSLTATTPLPTGAIADETVILGDLAATAPLTTAQIAGTQTNPCVLTTAVPLPTVGITGDSANPGTLSAAPPLPTGDIPGVATNPAALAAATPTPTATLPGTTTNQLNITVVATIEPPRWVGTIGARTRTATIGTNRHAATIGSRTKTATIDAPRWAGRITP